MRLSSLSIQRPVLATVLNLLILVGGGVAYFLLEVREYPDVDSPVVSITTIYVGASPETMEAVVTEPLEQVLNGLEGVRTLTSSSSFSASTINIEFEAGRDIDLAVTDVSNAIQQGLGELPPDAEKPIVTKAGSESQPLMWLSLESEELMAPERTDLAERTVKTSLQLLPGVAGVRIMGQRYAMRVWLDPARMASRGVDAADVRRAIVQNNLQVPAGEIEGSARKFTVNLDAEIDDPKVYERLVIRREGDKIVRIADVGWVELGAEDYRRVARHSGTETTAVGVIRQSRANELEVTQAVYDKLPEIRAALPAGITIQSATDFTTFVRETLSQVWETLAIVFALVVLVNLVFLRSKTTTIITAVAIPVSLVGTFAAMYLLDFSINALTLLAMVLAIGLLVDDSIVVMENIYRRQELGESPMLAARNGAREVGFPVIATTVAVIAVLVPLSMMTGNVGRLFREFALTMAFAVAISTFVALTAVPMACSRFLKITRKHGPVFNAIEFVLVAVTNLYRRGLAWFLRHRALTVALFALTLGATWWLVSTTPRTLVPVEDRGTIMTFIRAPQGSTAAYTNEAILQVEKEMKLIPEVDGFFTVVAMSSGGPGDTASGMVFTHLKNWDERDRTQQELVAELFPKLMAIPQALAFASNPSGIGSSGFRNADIQIALRSPTATLEEFGEVSANAVSRLRAMPELVNVDSDMRLENPQIDLIIDRERAADLGIPVSEIAEGLRLLVSQGRMDDFVMRSRKYDVVMALASRYRSIPEQLGEIHMRASDGTMVSMSSIVRAVPSIAPATLAHYNLQRAATVTANLAPDATMGDALDKALSAIGQELPAGFTTELAGSSREFVEGSGTMFLTFGIAILVIYLVLAAQFESFLHPLTVLLSVPLASVGALATLRLLGHTLNIYSAIGLVLLVGLVTKNSILLVDFANQERARGVGLFESLRAAGRTRFRPILMTSMTSILGALPLAFAVGAGAESRRPIGAVVVGGLVFSTIFTLLMIPAVHAVIIKLAERIGLSTVPPLVELEEFEPPPRRS